MRPTQVGAYTVAELIDMVDGFVWRDELEWERTAWAVAHLINISGKSTKSRVTAKKLLGRGITAGAATADQKQALKDSIKRSKLPDGDPRANMGDSGAQQEEEVTHDA